MMILCRIFVMSNVEKWVEFPHVKLQKSLRFERITGLIFYKKNAPSPLRFAFEMQSRVCKCGA